MAQLLGLLLCAAIALLSAEAQEQMWHSSRIRGPVKVSPLPGKSQRCSTWGRYHYTMFDGKVIYHPSDCTFLMTSSCSTTYKDFSVQFHRTMIPGGRVVISWVLLKLDKVSVEITLDGVLVNGKPCILPHSYSGVHVDKIDHYTIVKANLGLTAVWCYETLEVTLDYKYQGQTCGLCGDFNGDPLNEFYKNGVKMTNLEFARQWRRDNPSDTCSDIVPEPPTCFHMRPTCERYLHSPAFRTCHALLDVESFISACCEDICECNKKSMHDSSECICDTLAEFSRECALKGGNPGNWRTKDFCWKPCPLNMEYRECSSAVMDTCSNPEASSTNTGPCMAGCFCPEGTVLDDLTKKGCVPVHECYCSYNGNLYAPGKGYSSKCSNCVCESAQWTCMHSNCPGICSLQGGAHIRTFDGKTYAFHGDCAYTMAKGCGYEEFVIQVELRQCGSTKKQTCLKEVVLALKEDIIIIKSCGDVLLNNNYVKPPFVTVTVIILQPTTYYILVQTSVGLLLVVQLSPIMQVFVIVQFRHRDHMHGLCGNFNGNQADDFLTLSRVKEATGTGFANSWKTSALCSSVQPVYQDPCSSNQDKEAYAQHWCSFLTDKEGVFAPCHETVNPEIYKQRCMHDSCNCEKSEDCMCAAVSSYVYDCAAQGVQISGWRNVVCEKYSNSCPVGMVYSYGVTSGSETCRCKFASEPWCHQTFDPLDGCVCAPGTYLDDSGKCVPPKNCPCYHQGGVVPPGHTVKMNSGICTCHGGTLNCVGNPPHIDPPVKCIPPMVYFNCYEHGYSAKGKECEQSCSTLDSDCVSSGCVSGCMCPHGMVSDDRNGCIKREACPCIHNGQEFPPGESIKVDCNTCMCRNQKWVCTKRLCDSTCTVYGSGHYKTFDQHRYNFKGDCEYILVQDYCDRNKGTFRILAEDVPCGTAGKTCSKTIKIIVLGSELVLSQGKYDLQGSGAPFHVSTTGLYLVIEINKDIVIIWNRKTLLFIKLSQKYKGNVCGMCGNYDGNANNDQITRCGAVVVNSLVFGNSWKETVDCPDVPSVPDPCLSDPMWQPWAQKQCNILHNPVFRTCHLTVDPTPYYAACVFDTCGCDTMGECDYLCTAVAAYAEACNQAGICLNWRTPMFCPISCEFSKPPTVWQYKPCGDPCMKTCRNPSGRCSTEIPPLEGCYPKCPPHLPYFDEIAMACVAKEQCGCYDSDGKYYNSSDAVPTSQNCMKCICKSSIIQCHFHPEDCKCMYNGIAHPFGSILYKASDGHGNCFQAVCAVNDTIQHSTYPCPDITPPSTPPFLPTTPEPCEQNCFWTPWINSGHPAFGYNGGDDESIHQLLRQGYKICKHPVEVECRAVRFPEKSLGDLGQSVTCNTYDGFRCKNRMQFPPMCLDYEIRMKCCSARCTTETPTTTTTTSCETTTTPHCTTTTTCHPTTATTSTTSCETTTTPHCTTTTTTCDPTTSTTTHDCTTTSTTTCHTTTSTCHTTTTHCPTTTTTCHTTTTTTHCPTTTTTCHTTTTTCHTTTTTTHCPPTTTTTHCPTTTTTCHTTTTTTTHCPTTTTTHCPTTTTTHCPTTTSTTSCQTTTTTCHTTTTTCHTTTSATTDCHTTTKCAGAEVCEWSEWINLGPPSVEPYGKELETIQDIINAGYQICSSPVDIQCRAANYPYHSLPQLGQQVICDKNIGLVCKNNEQGLLGNCFDYEIRVKCCKCQATSTTTTPEPVIDCHCIHYGKAFRPGATVYNHTDHTGYCFIGICNQTCGIVIHHHQCLTIPPPPRDCFDQKPPRKHGETWKESGCRIATCKNGEVITNRRLCAKPEPIMCANQLPSVEVYDEDGCCFHYECQCLCYGWGDLHYRMFDGTYYSFQGNCSYYLVKEIFTYGFSVILTTGECDEPHSTCIQSITVFYNRNKIQMSQHKINGVLTKVVLVNDQTVSSTHRHHEFRITSTGINLVLLIPRIMAKITFTGRTYSIKLPISLFGGHIQGQCGNCNNNRNDDCIVPGTHIDSCSEMAHKWHTDDDFCTPPVPPIPHPTPSYCYNRICDIINSSVFQNCHDVVDSSAFYTACQNDVCKPHGVCLSLQMYAAACAQAGKCIEWRSATYGTCDYTCPSPKVYEACGRPVEPTCDSWFNNKFVDNKDEFTPMMLNQKFEGCYCPVRTILLSAQSNECVPSCEMCRLPNGKWKKANDRWIAGCDVCSCDEERLEVTCEPRKCPQQPPIICEHPGQVLIIDTVECCPRPRCECDKTLCPTIPSCPLGTQISTTLGKCCDKYECVLKSVCVFNDREYEVGDVVPRFQCESCLCSNNKDPETHLHVLECVSMSCDTTCDRGFEYQRKPGECCGRCVQICCPASPTATLSHCIKPGEVWSPPGNRCVKFECVQFVTVETKTQCPPFNPKDCIPGTEAVAPDGCCKVCIPRGQPCVLTSSMKVLEFQGCKSKTTVNMTTCSGACGTFTLWESGKRSLQRSCSCCQERSSSERKVQLTCPNKSQITFTYTHIQACACRKTQCTDPGPKLPYRRHGTRR